ncbi:hypothetical protein AWB74_04457 [Caballeronia arvi]|uniref:Uncharacterized protein n=1 Tax=Caballeronia arvi TaxID=1777135 RepID=A0A158JWF9_9BURK|nr:hypothetical protein AWB74_04457 [Caballeronia arvi]
MQPRERTEHQYDERHARRIERHYQHAQRADRVDAEPSDREGHRAECAERREPHDHREDAEQHVRDAGDQFLYRAPGTSTGVQCKAEQQCEQQHRQHLSFLEGADERFRNRVQHEFDESTRLRARRVLREKRGIQVPHVDVQSRARAEHERGGEPQDERSDGEKVEQCQRLQNGPSYLRAARKRGDAADDRAKHDRGDHHADQGNERIAE